jgi:hypothetical protein
VPSQVAAALGGTLQGVHEAPHESVLVLLEHAPPHRWKPLLQLKPHVPDVHVVVLFGTEGQGVQEVPQLAMLMSLAHVPLHRW